MSKELTPSSPAQVPVTITKSKSKALALSKVLGKDLLGLVKATAKVIGKTIFFPFEYWPDMIMVVGLGATIIIPFWWYGAPHIEPNGFNSPRKRFYRWKSNYWKSVRQRVSKELE